MYSQYFAVYIHNTNKYIGNSIINSSPYHKQTVYIHCQECMFVSIHIHTCIDSLYTRYIHGMYKITIL